MPEESFSEPPNPPGVESLSNQATQSQGKTPITMGSNPFQVVVQTPVPVLVTDRPIFKLIVTMVSISVPLDQID